MLKVGDPGQHRAQEHPEGAAHVGSHGVLPPVGGGAPAGIQPALQDHRGRQLVDHLARGACARRRPPAAPPRPRRWRSSRRSARRAAPGGRPADRRRRGRRGLPSASLPSGSRGRPSTMRSAPTARATSAMASRSRTPAVPLDGGVGLGGESQAVGDSHADPARPEVDAHDARHVSGEHSTWKGRRGGRAEGESSIGTGSRNGRGHSRALRL